MAGYEHKAIKEILNQIDDETIILPAMQRSFVWPEEKIYNLFDSLMRKYPIGTFLFWEIKKETFDKYVFNSFVKIYVEQQRGKFQRGNDAKEIHEKYKAVLDGQQRLTSLYIGTCGKERLHVKGKKWDSPDSFYDAYLCIDVLFTPKIDEKYLFEFQREDDIEKIIADDDKKHYWVKVNTVYNFKDFKDIMLFTRKLNPDEQNPIFTLQVINNIQDILAQLHEALSGDINYFPATDMDLSKVVDIFVRVNSGGEKLSSSDLMLSVAAGELKDKDVHAYLQDAINEINDAQKNPDTGFNMDKETILTAGLMFTGAESMYLSKSSNYTPERMKLIFETHWNEIIEALKNTVSYIEYIGFIGRKLSNSIILPIAYYFYKNKVKDSYKDSSKPAAHCDRIFIRQWLLRSMLKDEFMEGTAATLLKYRELISKTKKNHFPLEEILEKEIKKTLTITEDQIDEIMELKYGDSKIIPLFEELMNRDPEPNTDVDHIWPKAILNKKSEISRIMNPTTEQITNFKNGCNSILNLQLLRSKENREKSDTEYNKWLKTRFTDENALNNYLDTNLIPNNISYELKDIEFFWNEQKKLLSDRIREAFPNKFEDLIRRYDLQNTIK